MLTEDEFDIITRKARPRNLDRLSVEELESYKDQLEQEIARVEDAISRKKAYLDTATSLFGKKS